jgi:hypothetical protein
MRYSLFLLSLTLQGADLEPRTVREYDAYVAAALREMAEGPVRFAPAAAGEPVIEPWNKDPTADVHDGLIHDWVGAVFVPGVKARQAVDLLTAFERHAQIYAPDVSASKLISRDGGVYRSSLRLVKKKVITVTLDTEYETRYSPLGQNRWLGVIRSTRVQEVDGAGEAGESLKPEGSGFGFLWRLNSWWVVEERNGGVLLQLRSVTLTREIPFGVSWMVKPMVTSLPRESLASTLQKTAAALRAP